MLHNTCILPTYQAKKKETKEKIYFTLTTFETFRTSYERNTCTARTTYCLQMGHSFILLPQREQVTMWPHSSSTQSIGESMQIRHRLSSWRPPPVPDGSAAQREHHQGLSSKTLALADISHLLFIWRYRLFRTHMGKFSSHYCATKCQIP